MVIDGTFDNTETNTRQVFVSGILAVEIHKDILHLVRDSSGRPVEFAEWGSYSDSELKVINSTRNKKISKKRFGLMVSILDTVRSATTPQTGFHVYRKFTKKGIHLSFSGDDICAIMYKMHTKGLLDIESVDYDCGYRYLMP